MAEPRFGSERASMLHCGDDVAAKSTAAPLAVDLGFEPVDAGPLAEAQWLETSPCSGSAWPWCMAMGGRSPFG
jgi:8-hydroxy-5-deazaflavin:NADPH oxidoreductase